MGIFTGFLELIYPPRCHICRAVLNGRRGAYRHLCDDCVNNMARITSPLCPVCGIPFESRVEEDHLCGECLKRRPWFDALVAPYLYEGGIMEIIHQVKYNGRTYLAGSLGQVLATVAGERLGETGGMIIMPVPLHPRRLRERGFNQSLVLARAVAPLLRTGIDFMSLRRLKYTRPQTGLKRDERQRNVRGAFGLGKGPDLRGKTVILVDDVATTGNTLNECARVLKRAGCKGVYCLVLARAVW